MRFSASVALGKRSPPDRLLLAINALLVIVGALVVPSDAHKEGKGVRVGIVFGWRPALA